MTKLFSRGNWSLLFAIIAVLAAPAAAKETVPIKAHFTGTVKVTPLSNTEPIFKVEYLATGNSSHLGKSKATLVSPEVEVDLIGGEIRALVPEWVGTITAANGDQITGSYVLPDVVELSASGTFSLEADLKVTGGTGRFKGAKGNANASVSGNIFTATYSVDLKGEISTVGSSKK